MLIEFGRKDTAFLSNNLVICQFLIKKIFARAWLRIKFVLF